MGTILDNLPFHCVTEIDRHSSGESDNVIFYDFVKGTVRGYPL